MTDCHYCKKKIKELAFKCKFCDKYFCSRHRLPEDHNCTEMKNQHKNSKKWYKDNRSENDNYGFGTTLSAEELFGGPGRHDKKDKKRISIDGSLIPFWIILILIILSLVSPLFIQSAKDQEMQYLIGNPKPIYFYEINTNCNNEAASDIDISLEMVTNITGIKFVKIISPIALAIGGLSYNCESVIPSDIQFGTPIGESESGYIGGFVGIPFLFVWNNIRLIDTSEGVIIHETLHSLSFDHSDNPNKIMYPYVNNIILDDETSIFLKNKYSNNPFAYLNIIPFNLLVALAMIFFFTRNN